MIIASGLAVAMKPTQKLVDHKAKFSLETLIPKQFGVWRIDGTLVPVIADPKQMAEIKKYYSQTLARSYTNDKGQRVMLSIAYGSDQSDTMQVHRPEVCYPAQGLPILWGQTGMLSTAFGDIPVRKLVASRSSMIEPITYWITVGGEVNGSDFIRKLDKLKFTFTGVLPDGLLFRVSSISSALEESENFRIQEHFIDNLLASLTQENRERLIGKAKGK